MFDPVKFRLPGDLLQNVVITKNKHGDITGVKIGGGRNDLVIPFKNYDFLSGFKESGQHSFQDLTKTIGKQTQTQEAPRPAPSPERQMPTEAAQRSLPAPQRQVPAENVPRAIDSQRQSPPENAPPRGSNEPAPPRGESLVPAGNEGLPLASKGAERPSPLMGLGFPSSLPAKGALTSQGQGVFGDKKAMVYQQVLLAARLFSASEKGGGASLSASRTSLLLQQFKFLDQDCAKFDALVKQMAAQGKGISPEQTKQLNTALQALFKQFEGLQKQVPQPMPSSSKPQAEEALPKDLQKAIAMLKERCDKSVLQMQNQLDGKLAKLAGEIILKSNTNATPSPPSSSEKEAAAKPGQKSAAESSSSATSAAAAQAEKGSKQAMTLTPSLSISESTAQAGAESRGTGKPSTQPPQFIQTSAELHALNDKIQRKDLVAPLNVAVIYPFSTKEQSQSLGGVKAGGAKGKESQSSEGHGMGGGGHTQEMVLIPAGPVILEGPFLEDGTIESQIVGLDAFLIAAYPVTNEQFADWLNEAMEEGKIKIDEKGIVRDRHRNILCKIHRGVSTSQIDTEVVKGQMAFRPLKGTQRHPVVQVSWYGAVAYCNDNDFRLATEAEWEKAAGMSVLGADGSLKKFRFGFGKDEVDPSWANYRDEFSEYPDNRTSPVGFYNGETVFTKGGKNYKSARAVSPHGCYDMSGNVRQWVNEEVGDKKVAKGGSYNSPPLELFVSARFVLSPESCQPDTGFRVAFDL